MKPPKNANPWSRRANESSEAYEAFLAYRDLGPGRSIELASRRCNKHASILGRWSTKAGWVARCATWDSFLQNERDLVAISEIRKWERRRLAALELNWELSQKLRAKIDQMLAFQVHRVKGSKDGGPVVIEPAKWTYQSVALLARAAVEIEQAALEASKPSLDHCNEEQLRAIENAGVEPPDPGEAE